VLNAFNNCLLHFYIHDHLTDYKIVFRIIELYFSSILWLTISLRFFVICVIYWFSIYHLCEIMYEHTLLCKKLHILWSVFRTCFSKDVNAYFCHSVYYALNKKQEYIYGCVCVYLWCTCIPLILFNYFATTIIVSQILVIIKISNKFWHL